MKNLTKWLLESNLVMEFGIQTRISVDMIKDVLLKTIDIVKNSTQPK